MTRWSANYGRLLYCTCSHDGYASRARIHRTSSCPHASSRPPSINPSGKLMWLCSEHSISSGGGGLPGMRPPLYKSRKRLIWRRRRVSKAFASCLPKSPLALTGWIISSSGSSSATMLRTGVVSALCSRYVRGSCLLIPSGPPKYLHAHVSGVYLPRSQRCTHW